MKKSIEVIIKEKRRLNVTKRIKKVALGYASNYLIPNQLAEIATKGKIKHLNMLQSILSQKENAVYNQYNQIKLNLDKINVLHIRKKCSQNMQIFGSINENDIIYIIFNLTGQKIEKKQIITQLIKEIGIYKVTITLEEHLHVEIILHILPSVV